MKGVQVEPIRKRYAKNGDINVAYQVFGEGDVDLVMVTLIGCFKEEGTMKSFLILGITIALFIVLGCSQQKTEELHGTWMNTEYKEAANPDHNYKQKLIFYADGKFENYKIKSEPKADFKAVYKIEEKWTDNDGNIWYKYRLTEKSWDGAYTFYLAKISNSGKDQECQYEFEYYPKKIDPSRLAYRKYYRE
jgi:hypothetical protein